MAVLAAPHRETISPAMHLLMEWIGQQAFSSRFYLAGGTALALRLGHRRSIDLDFFSERDEVHERTRQEMIRAFSTRKAEVLENVDGNLLINVDGLHVGFFSYGYALLEPTEMVGNIHLASLLDLGLMKLDALMGRGMRKDFYDVYFFAPHIPLDELVARWEDKYSHSRGLRMRLLTALVDFAIADQQQDPILLAPVSWRQVKTFCEAEARRLSNLWFAQTDSERS